MNLQHTFYTKIVSSATTRVATCAKNDRAKMYKEKNGTYSLQLFTETAQNTISSKNIGFLLSFNTSRMCIQHVRLSNTG